MVRCLAPDVGLDDPQPLQVGLEVPGVLLGDLPGGPVLAAGRDLQLVVALVGVGRQVPDVGDVDDVPDAEALPA